MATDIFAEKLKKYGVTSNCYHPGLVNTNIFSTTHFEGSTVIWLAIKAMKYAALLIGKVSFFLRKFTMISSYQFVDGGRGGSDGHLLGMCARS